MSLLPHSTIHCNLPPSPKKKKTKTKISLCCYHHYPARFFMLVALTWTKAAFLSSLLSCDVYVLTGYTIDAQMCGVRETASTENNSNYIYCQLLAETHSAMGHERWEFTRKKCQGWWGECRNRNLCVIVACIMCIRKDIKHRKLLLYSKIRLKQFEIFTVIKSTINNEIHSENSVRAKLYCRITNNSIWKK